MRIKDKELFAASVVQSSSHQLSTQEKLDLFIEAKKLAKKYNNDLTAPAGKAKVWKD